MTDINRNEAWKVESTGIDRVPDAEQTGKPIELFWIWSAANIGILGVVYGAIIVGFGLSFLQSVLPRWSASPASCWSASPASPASAGAPRR